MAAELLHFPGEVEVVFGIWLVPLVLTIISFRGWAPAVHYFHDDVNLTEAAFIVVIMVLVHAAARRCASSPSSRTRL